VPATAAASCPTPSGGRWAVRRQRCASRRCRPLTVGCAAADVLGGAPPPAGLPRTGRARAGCQRQPTPWVRYRHASSPSRRRARRRITATATPAGSTVIATARPPPARPSATRVAPAPATPSRRQPSCSGPPGTTAPRPPASQTVRSTVLCIPTRAELSERLPGNPYTHTYMGGGADGSVGDGPGRGEAGSPGSGGNGSGGSGSGDGNGEGIVIGAPSVAGCSTISVRRRRAQDQTCQQLAIRASPAAARRRPRRARCHHLGGSSARRTR